MQVCETQKTLVGIIGKRSAIEMLYEGCVKKDHSVPAVLFPQLQNDSLSMVGLSGVRLPHLNISQLLPTMYVIQYIKYLNSSHHCRSV